MKTYIKVLLYIAAYFIPIYFMVAFAATDKEILWGMAQDRAAIHGGYEEGQHCVLLTLKDG